MVRRAAVEITLPPVQSVPTASHLARHLPAFGLILIPSNISFYGPFQALLLGLWTLSQDETLPVGFDRIPTDRSFCSVSSCAPIGTKAELLRR